MHCKTEWLSNEIKNKKQLSHASFVRHVIHQWEAIETRVACLWEKCDMAMHFRVGYQSRLDDMGNI